MTVEPGKPRRPRSGRPLGANQARVAVRFTDADWAVVLDAADEARLPPAVWARQQLVLAAERAEAARRARRRAV